ncbi:MAG: MFS transporter, partial [Tetragenococcus koreensis]
GLSYSNIMTLSLSKLPRTMIDDGNSIYMTAQSYAGSLGIALSASIMGLMQGEYVSLMKGTLAGYKTNLVVFVILSILILGMLIQGMRKK